MTNKSDGIRFRKLLNSALSNLKEIIELLCSLTFERRQALSFRFTRGIRVRLLEDSRYIQIGVGAHPAPSAIDYQWSFL
jgi:hypothetical protein